MAIITKLDESLSNLIAAGEVVERPLSVVKELVENSIDANSTEIEINLVESGMKEIEVIDNGMGMDKIDARMCFLPHATSKIKNKSDLFKIQTLGFRGEAIPSIAAVSDMRINTSNGIENTFINYRAGKLIKEENSNMNKGTKINVLNLFYNTPARLKYLKSPNTELAVIVEFVTKIALANPLIRFKLTNNQKTLIQTYGNGDIIGLIGNIYGYEIAKKVINADIYGDGFEVKCFLIEPFINRTKRDYITLIVNGRVVKNNELIYAVIDAYNTLLPIGRYPIAVLNIKIDPLLIDVNVHPNKKEIRFSNVMDLCEKLKTGIFDALNKKPLIPDVDIKKYEIPTNISKTDKFVFDQLDLTNTVNQDESKIINVKETKINENLISDKQHINKYIEEYKETFKKDEPKLPYLEYIGIFSGTYLLFQNEEGLYLVDQHAAAERIRYEYYYEYLGKKSASQQVIPYNLELQIKDFNFLKENINILFEYGFVLEESGINSFYVREIPLFIKNNEEEYTKLIIDHILKYGNCDISKIRDELAKSIACKGAIKANHNLLSNEAISLIDKLRKCNNPYTCPHGRPTIIKLTHYEIEKMFKRVM